MRYMKVASIPDSAIIKITSAPIPEQHLYFTTQIFIYFFFMLISKGCNTLAVLQSLSS